MYKTVSEQWCDMLVSSEFSLLYSLAGESDNGLMSALHREKRFRKRVEMQQEASAVLAAGAAACLTGESQVCYAGRFPGLCAIAAAWGEAQSMSAPVLVLGVVPGGELSGLHILGSHTAQVVRNAEDAAAYLAEAIRRVRYAGEARLLLLQEDIADEAASEFLMTPPPIPAHHPLKPHPSAIAEFAAILEESQRAVFLCGGGCRGAREEILAVARRLQAPVAVTMNGKDVVEGDNELSIGMIGPAGWGAAPYAVADCDVLVLWGTDFSSPEYLPRRCQLVQVDRDSAALGRRAALRLGVAGDVRQVAQALLPLLSRQRSDDFAAAMRSLHRRELARLESHVRNTDESQPLYPELVTRMLSDMAEPDAVFCVDTGEPLIWCARFLHPSHGQRLTGAFRTELGECALPMGVGIKAVYSSRQVIAVCSTEGALRYLSELLTLQRDCLSLKMLVFRSNLQDSIRIGTVCRSQEDCPQSSLSVAALSRALGLVSFCVRRSGELRGALRRWLSESGPALLEAEVGAHALQLPPDIAVSAENGQHFSLDSAPGSNTGKQMRLRRRFYP